MLKYQVKDKDLKIKMSEEKENLKSKYKKQQDVERKIHQDQMIITENSYKKKLDDE
jgi:hypothetical protein